MEQQTIQEIMTDWKMDRSYLIEILQDVQEKEGYIPEDVADYIATELEVPKHRLYHIATFYSAFTLKPKGTYQINVCTGTACHVRGGSRILEQFERELGIQAGDTTNDRLFSLDSVRCVGCCALAPVVVVNDNVHGSFKTSQVKRLIKRYRSQLKSAEAGRT